MPVIMAVPVYATNGDQMLGVNAIQWSMGGAVIAAPQEAGTVFSNPAGIAVLDIDEFRLDMGLGLMNPVRDVNGIDSETDVYLVPAGAVVFGSEDRLKFGAGMGGISGMGVNFADISPAAGSQPMVTTKQFFKIVAGMGYAMNNDLAIGLGLHINWQSVALNNSMFQFPQNQVYGYGYSLGTNYRINSQWQLGAAYTSRQSMAPHKWNTINGRYSLTMNAPEQLALGLAYTVDDTLYEFDVRRIGFSDVVGNVPLNTPSGPSMLPLGWEDQTVIAFGARHNVDEKLTLRTGLNYGKSPIGAEDVDTNLGSLAVTELHVSFGLTRKTSKHLYASFSFTHAFENRVASSTSPNEIGLSQNVIYLQLSYR